MLVTTEGIVIRTRDYGEAHKVVVLYTNEHGKIALMARGVKKPRSRLRGLIQILTHGQYLYFSSTGMGTLNQGEVVTSFQALRDDIVNFAYASYIVELLDKLTEERDANAYIFQLLKQTLLFLEQGKDADILCRLFEIKLLNIAGYRPVLETCVKCRATEPLVVFSVSRGGLLCDACRTSDPHAIVINARILQLLRLFLTLDLRRLGEINVKRETKEVLERIMKDYFDYHVDIPIKSRSFIKQIKEMNSN